MFQERQRQQVSNAFEFGGMLKEVGKSFISLGKFAVSAFRRAK